MPFPTIHNPFWTKVLMSLVLLAVYCEQLEAQRYYVQNFSLVDGLSQSEVGAINQFRDGRLIVDTEAFGVDVFDGERFSSIAADLGLTDRQVLHITSCDDSTLAIISSNLLVRSSGVIHQIDSLQFSGPTPAKVYDAHFYPEEKSHFLLASDQGLYDCQDGICALLLEVPKQVYDVHPLGADLYLGTEDGLMNLAPGDKEPSALFSASPVYVIAENAEGNLICGTQNGFFTWAEQELKSEIFLDNPSHHVTDLLIANDGRIWMATSGDGIYIWDDKSGYEHISTENGLSDNFIWCLYEDMDDNMWIGSSGDGLDLIGRSSFKVMNEVDGLQSDISYCFAEYAEGLMIGSVEGGLDYYTDAKLQPIRLSSSEDETTSVRSLLRDGDSLWVGTDEGLLLLHDDRVRDVSKDFQIDGRAVYDICKDREGHYWFACRGTRYFGANGALVKWDSGVTSVFEAEHGISDEGAYSIFEASSGIIYAGTSTGLVQFDGEVFRPLTKSTGDILPQNVHAIAEVSAGQIWLGARNGLWTFDGTHIEHVELTHLNKDPVYFILPDQNKVWLGTSKGICALNLYDNPSETEFSSSLYTEREGVIGTECNQNACLRDSQGQLWFGTIGGVVKYDPQKGLQNPIAPRLERASYEVLGEANLRTLGQSGQGTFETIALSHDKNSLRIGFEAISLLRPDLLRYSYRISEGIQTDWTAYTDQNHVQLAGLAPGEYDLSFRAIDIGNGLMSPIRSVHIRVIPAFWQTLWFKVLSICLLALAIALFFLYRLRAVRQEEARNRAMELRATRSELAALRAQMNPHFLFNSLNALNALVIKGDKRSATNYISKFARLIRAVLQHSREGLITLDEEIETLELYIHVELSRMDHEVHYSKQIQDDITLNVIRVPPMTLQPFVENAIWHGIRHLEERDGILKLEVIRVEEGVEVRITDNGVGRDASASINKLSPKWKESLGSVITDRRLELMNEIHGDLFSIRYEDLQDEDHVSLGTRVVLQIKS